MSVDLVQTPDQSPPEVFPPKQVHAAGHAWTIFVESGPLVQAMIDDIQRAQVRIWVEVYIFLDDKLGRAVAEALKERARAGVDVRVLYDFIGSQTTPSSFFRDMALAGVKVHAYHTLGEAIAQRRLLFILNRRDHRKIVVIDDKVAYFGGMNLFDHSSAAAHHRADLMPGSNGWRDVHVRIAGPKQRDIAESFERSWQRAHHLPLSARPKAYRLGLLNSDDENVQFFDSGPGRKFSRAGRVFVHLFRAAQKSITLSMAYFLPVGAVLRELHRAHSRGVFIRVVVPGDSSDVPLVRRATRHLYSQLLKRRFHIYERQEQMLHSKVMVVDDRWTVLGSSNLDARSLWFNLEFLAIVRSPTLAATITSIIEYEIERRRRRRLRDYALRNCWQRGVDRLAWSCRWWL
jgi:cardiolipin synthase